MATESERQLSQLHPGVYSQINSKDDVYNIADGIVTLMAVDAFERGVDGRLEFVSTPEEFKFKFGDPNFDKYGQQGYNIVQWLAAGGQAYVMRVLPDDASFAHAIVNIQTKVTKGNAQHKSGKMIHLDATNEDVYIDDVKLRPTETFIKKNNINKDILLSELSKLRTSEDTVDGYRNNFIFMVYPEGRGSYYNNLGFRIYTNSSFENVQASRVYNFEILRYNDQGQMDMIEGPFYVSFDSDAIDGNGESMFIEDVINHYSKYLNVKFNREAYLDVAKDINPNVSPNEIDILSGKTSVDSLGNRRTYFDETTRREEDVHLSLFKYNSAGHPVESNGKPVLNITEADDQVEKTLVDLDNNIRELNFNTERDKNDYMKKDFKGLLEKNFTPFKLNLSSLYNSTTDSQPASGKIPDLLKSKFNKDDQNSLIAQGNSFLQRYQTDMAAILAGNASEENDIDGDLALITKNIDQIISTVRGELLDLANQVDAMYQLTQHGNFNTTVQERYVQVMASLNAALLAYDKVNIFTIQHRDKITKILEDIANYRLGLKSTNVIEGANDILARIEEEIRYIWGQLIPVAFTSYDNVPQELKAYFDATNETSITSTYNNDLVIYEDLESGHLTDDPLNPVNINKILSDSAANCNALLTVIRQVTFIEAKTVLTVAPNILKNDFEPAIKALHDTILQQITPQATYDEEAIRQTARDNIDIQNNTLVATNSKFFNTALLNFDSPVKLLMGSDGAFTYDTTRLKERKIAINKQIINGYSGSVFPEISDTKLYAADVILDAGYNNEVKIAISNFVRERRKDMQFFSDTKGPDFPVSPEDALNWRRQNFNIVSEFVSVFTQDLTYYDEYTGRDVRFTTTYPLASKIPHNAEQYGLHYPLAGPRRGIIDGMSAVSWYPNEAYKEKLYAAHLNYLQYDNNITTLGSQSTTKTGAGALTQINNMFTILKMKRGCEQLCSNYIFEFNDETTTESLYSALNNYLNTYTSNRSCESVKATISASDYDKQQRILRVRITVKFTGIIERIALDFDVS